MKNEEDIEQCPVVAEQRLKIISDYAQHKGKLVPFTQIGLEFIPNGRW